MAARRKAEFMEVARASLNQVRISPLRLRLVVNLVRGLSVDAALQVLQFNSRKGARLAEKLLRSAIANAREKDGIDVDKLWVSGGYVDSAKPLKRIWAQARGSAALIRRRSSHMTIILGEKVR